MLRENVEAGTSQESSLIMLQQLTLLERIMAQQLTLSERESWPGSGRCRRADARFVPVLNRSVRNDLHSRPAARFVGPSTIGPEGDCAH